MSGYGDFFENRVTGERAVVLRGPDDGAPLQTGLVHLTVKPHGAVLGEHVHPDVQERFVVIAGTLGTRVGGIERELRAGEEATATPGTAHDWWNAGDDEASVLVELDGPPEQRPRFEAMIATIFGLANDGRTNSKGMPRPLQLALLAREFDDVVRFTKPPRAVQKALFSALAPLARARGLRPIYPEYLHPHGRTTPDPAALACAGMATQPAP